MANITKVGKAYKITVSCGIDYKGRQIRKCKNYKPKETAPTKIEKEVLAAAAEFEKAVQLGQLYDGERMTFYVFTEKYWFPGYAEKNLSTSVLHDYRRKLENWIYPAIGSMKLSRITALQLNMLYDDILKSGCKPVSVKRYHATLQSVFKYAFKSGVIRENPCLRCTLPKEKEKFRYTIWTPEQVDTFFRAMENTYIISRHVPARTQQLPNGTECLVPEFDFDTEKCVSQMYIAMYTLFIYSSARRGEIAALTWEDINFISREIRINKAVSYTRQEQILKAPKTESGYRRITLPAKCLNALKKWKQEEMKLSLQLGSLWEGYRGKEFDKNYVFIQRDSGKLICLDTITQKFKQIVADYNATCENEYDRLPEIRLHDLRHTGASLLIAAGEDIITVSHRLGHAKPSTTMEIYSHALPLKDKEACDLLERIISR